jgi:hypothetical protein
MNTLHSNHPHFQPAEHTFFRLYEPCDFCRVSVEENELSKVGGYSLCDSCKAEYIQDEKDNAILAEGNLINIKYSGDVSAPF